jgi:aquaporin Z
VAQASARPPASWRGHWPEYLIEGWALGSFMLSAGVFTVLLESPALPIRGLVPDPFVRRAIVGTAMGLTAIGLIYSPWGRRSGAHMNPAVTLSFMRLGLVRPVDGLLYGLSQLAGGTLGVIAGYLITAGALARPEANWVATVPGSGGLLPAFALEFAMALALMFIVLRLSSSASLRGLTGCAAGVMVALFITFEAPHSGMSINPARSLASALPSGLWPAFWIYLLAPPLGMLAVAELHRRLSVNPLGHCAKLVHDQATRCIHCGYMPPIATTAATLDPADGAGRRSHV